MTPVEHLIGIFYASLLFWLFFGLYTSIRVQMFIVKRYEQETDLLNTVFFREHCTFSYASPGVISTGVYSFHLISFIWGWRYWKKKKPFRDIDDPSFVTQHFSKKEIRLVKRHTIIGIIFLIHLAIYLTLKFVCPEVLDL